ncbi:MAG: putative porin [Candidatus Omnitrophica bacterium]|nr:putative porin [Candidatus Omnitrophota bacterium]MCM8801781.1 putative porin [Candidatus Omnitrophota bacterium]
MWKFRIIIFSSLLSFSFLFAGEMDILLEKLIKKGVLTKEEAKEIKEEVKKEKEKEKYSFLKDTKFSGDLRIRYQRDNIEGEPHRDRERFRGRFGFKTNIGENTEVGMRLATGVGEQTSTNQTFENAFSQKNIWIDRFYVKHRISDFGIIAGKMENPFYCTDMIWDSDINPEGIAFTYQKNNFFTNLGVFILDEFKSSTDDPMLYSFQIGYKGKIIERDFKIGFGLYLTDSLKNKKQDDISPNYKPKGNTLTSDGKYSYEYKPLSIPIEFTVFEVANKSFKLYGEYIRNIESGVSENEGYLIGFTFGKLKEKGDWEFGYNYRKIEGDATLAILSDSDINGGGTSLKGHKISFGYQVSKNSSFGITYFIGQPLSPRTDKRNTLQIDYLIKF